MAGVGIRLQRVLRQDTLFAYGACAFYGSAIASGPWITIVAALAALLAALALNRAWSDSRPLFAAIIYASCFSSIASAPCVIVSVRQAADAIWRRRLAHIPPALSTALLGSVLCTAAVGGACLVWIRQDEIANTPILLGVFVVSLIFAAVWVLFGTLSYVQWMRPIAVVVIAGVGIALLGGMLGYYLSGSFGALLGFALGWLLMGMGLYVIWRARCPRGAVWDLNAIKGYSDLGVIAAVGLFYQLGLWADKIVVWAVAGEPVNGVGLRLAWPYEALTLAASFSVLPGLAFFIVSLETRFVQRYRRYLTRIHRGTFDAICDAHQALLASMFAGLSRLLEYQGVATLLALFLAEPLMRACGLDPLWKDSFRWLLIAAFGHVCVLAMVTFLLYFERRWEALCVTVCFSMLGFALTIITGLYSGVDSGIGPAIAAFVSAVVGFCLLRWRSGQSTYLIFTRQPIL